MAYDYIGICNDVLKAVNEVQFADATEFGNATGFHAFVKDAVNYAIGHIYEVEDNNWEWQITTQSETLTTDGAIEYSIPAAAAEVDWESFFIEKDVALDFDQAKKLTEIPYSTYRDNYFITDKNLTSDEYGVPDIVARGYDNNYFISPPPNEAFTLKYDYFTRFVPLSASTDTTSVPVRYKQVIIDGALRHVYDFRDNLEQSQLAEQRFEAGINNMRRNLIPQATTMIAIP